MYFLFKKNMFASFVKYMGKCLCVKGKKRPKQQYKYRKKPPDIKESKLRWLKWNMARELDLKRIITKIYCFEKNFESLAERSQLTLTDYDDINLLKEW